MVDEIAQNVKEYVEHEANENVVSVELVHESEPVFDRAYSIYDVKTTDNEWWVATPPTNLYLKKQFENFGEVHGDDSIFDAVVSFHHGLMSRVMARNIEEDEQLDDSEMVQDLKDDGPICIRAKWTMDDAETLSDAADHLLGFAFWLKELEELGWQLEDPIKDDCGFIVKEGVEVGGFEEEE